MSWILDADVRSFFDTVSQEWLIRLVEHRIGDRRIIRLIRKWLKAGVVEDGIVAVSDKGTGQGAVTSPLHYVDPGVGPTRLHSSSPVEEDCLKATRAVEEFVEGHKAR